MGQGAKTPAKFDDTFTAQRTVFVDFGFGYSFAAEDGVATGMHHPAIGGIVDRMYALSAAQNQKRIGLFDLVGVIFHQYLAGMIQFAQGHALRSWHGIPRNFDPSFDQTPGHVLGFLLASGMAFPGAIVTPDNEHPFARLDKFDNLLNRFLDCSVHCCFSFLVELIIHELCSAIFGEL